MSNSQPKGAIVPPPSFASFPLKEEQLQHSLLRGIAWTGGVKWASQLLSWVSTIVVARLLTPEDYGLVAMATAFLGLVALVNEFGLGSAIVMLPELHKEQIAQLNSLAVLLGIAGFAVVCLAAVPLGTFYGSPDLPLVVVILGVGFIIGAFRSVPCALLERTLQFKKLAFLEGGQSIVGATLTVALALGGAGYWSLILGNLASSIVVTLVVVTIAWNPFLPPNIRSLANVLRFSWHVFTTRVSWYIASNSDVFVAGRVLGQAGLGVYTFSATLANVPLEKITGMVNRVAPAFYSAAQADHEVLRRYLLNLTEGLALITIPAAWGLMLVADDFVQFVLGEKWSLVAAPLRVLAAYAALRSITTLISPLFFLTGGSRLAMWNGVLAVAFFPIGFYIGSGWGIVGVAVAWMVVHPLNLIPMYWYVLPKIGLSFWQYVRVLWPAFSGTVVMTIAVYAVRMTMPPGSSLITRFLVEIVGGGMAYLLAILILHRGRLTRFIDLLRNARS